jgi:hypothetical protein
MPTVSASGVAQPRLRSFTPRVIALACLIAVGVMAAVIVSQGRGSGIGHPPGAKPGRASIRWTLRQQAPPALASQGAPSRRAGLWWRRLPRTVTATFPFQVPDGLRSPRSSEAVPALYADGLVCSIGCRPPGALDGWPLHPFHRQHPLRAALNELRPESLHVGLDIQARDGAAVYAVQGGYARVLATGGPDARVQVGNYIYWHITPVVRSGELVRPFRTELGRVMAGYGHLAFSEVDGAGQYVNPLRPGGRVLAPWRDHYPPVIGRPAIATDGTAVVEAFDPQSEVRRTTYRTPVLAPAAIAYRLYLRTGQPVTPLEFSFRGTRLLPWAARRDIFAPGAHAPGFECFARHSLCRPRWRYWLAGGLAPRLPVGVPAGSYRLTVYAWDWADNRSALDTIVWKSQSRWHPRGRVPPRLPVPYGLPLRLAAVASTASIPR